MASPNIREMLDSVVMITNHVGGTGTGFFVARRLPLGGCQIFVITNKHVFHSNPSERDTMPMVFLDVSFEESDGTRRKEKVEIGLGGKSRSRLREHPNSDIDVMAMDITDIKIKYPGIVSKCFEHDKHLATKDDLKVYEIEAGDDVLVAGFPLGITQGTSNRAILRQAMVASHIGEPLEDASCGRTRTLPAFLVDGGVVHGSSGSPVILKPVIGRMTSKGIQMGDTPLLVLGIIAETRFGSLSTSKGEIVQSYAGLGMAFDATTITEVLSQFPEPT